MSRILLSIILISICFSCNDRDDLGTSVSISRSIVPIEIPQVINGEIVNRRALIKYPSGQSKGSYPVVFFFHNQTWDAEETLNLLEGAKLLIESEEFIGIFPQGYQNTWNAGLNENLADDPLFLDRLMLEVRKIATAQQNRVYAIGFEEGAVLVNRLGKETNYFEGIATIYGQQTTDVAAIDPENVVSVFQLNSSMDGFAPVAGGTTNNGYNLLSAEESARDWSGGLNCALSPELSMETWGDYAVSSYNYPNCIRGKKVRYHIVEDAPQLSAFGTNDFLVSRIWDFFNEAP
ncbi:MAG: hypothetical protein AAF242_01160 [Bacteroidota bacterium]